MPKLKNEAERTSPVALQAALDSCDVVGNWDWDITADRVNADALVALLFNVDPEAAEAGAPISAYTAGILAEDRARVIELLGEAAREGSAYIAEYRVRSADGVTRWLLARGRFQRDGAGRPLRGRGIVVDITDSRLGERAYVTSGMGAATSPLEEVADRAIALHRAVLAIEDTQLRLLSDTMLMELGRRLAKQEVKARRRRMN